MRLLFADVEGAEGNSNGFGIEFYVETPTDEIAADLGDITGSWQFQMLYQISQLAASEAAALRLLNNVASCGACIRL